MEEEEVKWAPPTDAIADTEPAWKPPVDAVAEEPVKKKDASSSLGGADFITQQRQQFEQPGQPSKKPTEKSTPKKQDSDEGNQFLAALRSMADAYKQPADPKDARPDYLVNAVKRGLNLADQANILGPFAGKPDADALKRVTDLQKQTSELSASDSYNNFTQAKSLKSAVTELAKDPAKIIVELTGESLASMAKYGAPRVAAGAAVGGIGGAAVGGVGAIPGAAGGALVGMADTSYGLEFTGKFMESLKEAGVDINDPKSLEKAFSDEETMSKARAAANLKAIPIALFDLVSGGIAGKIVTKPAASIAGKIGKGLAEFGVQAAFDAGGEIAGELASGEDVSAGAVLAEVVGGVASTPVEIALGASTLKKDVIDAAKSDVDITNEQSVDAAADKIENALNKENDGNKEELGKSKIQQPGGISENNRITEQTELRSIEENSNPESNYGKEVNQKSGEIIPRAEVSNDTDTPTQNSGYPSQLYKDLEQISGDKKQAESQYKDILDDAGEFKKKHGDWENRIMKSFKQSGNKYSVKQGQPNDDSFATVTEDKDGNPEIVFNEKKLRREGDFSAVKNEYAAEVQKENSPEYTKMYDKVVNKLRDLKLHIIHQQLIRKQKGTVTTEDNIASLKEIERINDIPLAKDYYGQPMLFMHAGPEGIQKFMKPGDKGYVQSDIMTGSAGIYFSRSKKGGKYYSEFGKDQEGKPAKGKDIYYVFLKTKNPYYMTDPRAQADYPLESSETISKKDVEALKAKGYDSVIWDKESDPKHEVVVFEPDQVDIIGSHNKGLNKNETTQQNTPEPPDSTSPDVRKSVSDESGKENVAPVNDGNTQTEKSHTGSAVLDQPESKRVSGIKKSLVPKETAENTDIDRRTFDGMLNQAKSDVDSGKVNPKAITDEIAKGNARALQPDEVSALVYYKTQIDNRADQLHSELIDAIESKDDQAQARLRTELDAVNQEVDAYNTMAVKTAYEQSLAFNMRKMLLDNEYNLQSQVNKYKATNNGQITTEVEKKFKDLDQKLKDTNAKLKKLEEKQSKERGAQSLGDVRILLQKQKEKRAQAVQQQKQKINAFFDSIKVKTDPNKLNSITQVIGESVYNGSVEAVRAAVLTGADLASALQAGVDYVKEHYRGNDFDEDAYSSTLRPGLESLIPSDDDLPSVKMVDGKIRIPNSLLKQLIDSGMDDINTIVDAIHSLIKDEMPDVSKREIRDAITAYGQTRYLSQEEINVKLREIKRMGKLVSQLEDVQNKQRPLRSGLQRDKLTDEERRLQRQVKEGMKDIPVDPDEEARAWKNSLDSIKSRLKNQIADLERQIETGEKTPKKKGIDYDQEAKSLQERRDELKAVIESIEGKSKLSDEQRVRQAVNSTSKQITELERKLSEKDTSKTQRASLPESQELKDIRAKRDDLRAAYKEMEKELGVAEANRLSAYKKAIQKSTARYEQRLRDKEFTNEKPRPLALDEEATKLKLERDKIKQDFDLEQEKARMANRSMGEKVWDTTMDVWNLPKSFLASIDMSAPFRQGAILSVANPTAGAKSFGEMFRQAFSEKKANEWLLKLRESPEYAVMKNAKLYLAEPTTKLTAKEESFLSNMAGRIPLIGPLVKGSERAYTGYLNKLRVDVFALGADQLRQQGITPESNPDAYKSWANFINNATGRGNLGGMEMAAPVLNGLFFSPRYVASRVNLLNPVTYGKMPAPVRKMALKNVVAWIGFNSVILALFSAAGADVELDPRSSDFGKIKIGDTRYDVWAGFQQIVRLIAQVTTGQRKSTKTGEITDLNKDKFPYETRADVALRFGRSKLSPSAGTVANLLAGETIVGEEVTIQGELVKNVVPLYLQDMKGIYEEEGATGLTQTMIPSFFGIGVQSYSGKSGLQNKEIDTNSEIQKLNKERKYSISEPTKSNLTESLDHEADDDTMQKFLELRDKEIKRQFDRYKGRLEAEKDIQLYDKLMDQIVREAGRHAKYTIARERGWRDTAKEFNPGDPFRLRNYKKNEEGKVVPR